jgi:putative nucleotidyltransferase with HDIG domain
VTNHAPLTLSPVLDRVRPLLSGREQLVYVVGGTVRDALMGRAIHDIDLIVESGAITLTFHVADALGWPAYVLDGERDVGRIIVPGQDMTLDIARYRGPTLEDDLQGRDFTVNAMALPIDGSSIADIIDRHNGLPDLAEKQIRIIHPQSIMDDPVRALRAVRFATQFGFALTSETAEAAKAAAPLLREKASAERLRDELSRLLATDSPHSGVAMLHELGILPYVLPDLSALAELAQSPPHHEDVFRHTLSVLRYLTTILTLVDGGAIMEGWAVTLDSLLAPYREGLGRHLAEATDGGMRGRLLLMWGALFHDIGKRHTQTIDDSGRIRFLDHDKVGAELASKVVGEFSFSNEARQRVYSIVGGHMRPLFLAVEQRPPSRRTVYRYFRALHSAGLDVGLLALADHLATYNGIGNEAAWESLQAVVGSLFETYFNAYETTVAPPRLLDGRTIMALLEAPPGHEIGRLLRLLEEAQASGEVNSPEEALAFVRHHHAGK